MIWVKEATTFVKLYQYNDLGQRGYYISEILQVQWSGSKGYYICETLQVQWSGSKRLLHLWNSTSTMIWVKEATTFVKLYQYNDLGQRGYYICETLQVPDHVIIRLQVQSQNGLGCATDIEATDICETLQTLCHVITRLWFQPQNLLWQRPLGDDLSQALQRGYYIYETLQAVHHVIIRLQVQSQKIWAVHDKEATTFVKLHKRHTMSSSGSKSSLKRSGPCITKRLLHLWNSTSVIPCHHQVPSPVSKDLGHALQRGYYICETLQAVYHVIIRLQVQSQKICAVHYKEATIFVKLCKQCTMSSSGSKSSLIGLSCRDHLVMIWALLVRVSSFSAVSPSRTRPKFSEGSSTTTSGPWRGSKIWNVILLLPCLCKAFSCKKY